MKIVFFPLTALLMYIRFSYKYAVFSLILENLPVEVQKRKLFDVALVSTFYIKTNSYSLALILRVISALCSYGYGWYDDHFLVVEVAQGWADGENIGGWLPDLSKGIIEPKEHSLFYPGIHFLLFKAMNFLGIADPQLKMILIRLLHAIYSLLIVYYGYKIAKKLTDEKCASCVGLLLAGLWFMPNLSVRNLVEMVCIPPLLFGCWWLIKDENNTWRKFFIAGFVTGFAFSIRYQSALFIGGMGLVLILERRWKGVFLFGMGCALNILLFQCIVDYFFWGYPFAEFIAYAKFNIIHRDDFIKGYWFNYPLLIAGMIIPPLSLMFGYGYFRNIRRRLILFLPSFIFLFFHCVFPNKQERFILPFIPFFIILGCTGWYDYQTSRFYHSRYNPLIKRMIWFAVAINAILLCVFSISSTKTSRMDAMYYIYKRHDVKAFIVECTYQDGLQLFPRFYLGTWCDDYYLTSGYSASQLKSNLGNSKVQPNYVIFLSDNELDSRIAKFKESFPHIQYLSMVEPSFIDKLFYKLNPVNKNEPCYIYKIGN